MTMQLYPPKAPFDGTYDYAVLLDDSKGADDSNVVWYQFPIPARDTANNETAPAYQTRLQQFRQQCVTEVRLLAKLEAQTQAKQARVLARQDTAAATPIT